jgi:hypothetical protein
MLPLYADDQPALRLNPGAETDMAMKPPPGLPVDRPDDPPEQAAAAATSLAYDPSSISGGLTSTPGIIQYAPDTHKPPASPTQKPPTPPPQPPAAKPAKPKPHSLKVQIKIADVIQVVRNVNTSRYDDFTKKTIPKELLKRLTEQVKGRLSFLADQGFQVSVELGIFQPGELKVPGNIQVWLVDELDDANTTGKVMKGQYGYKDATAKAANESFADEHNTGPGHDFKQVGGITPPQIDDSAAGTSRPVFVKVPQLFSRDEISHFKEGKKEEAELGIDEISATTSHEIGHVLRAEPGGDHAKGKFNDSKQNFPPRLMDTVGARSPWKTSGESAVPRFSTEANDKLSKEDVDKLGGWPGVWDTLVLPNVGPEKVIRRAHVTEDGGLEVWYNFHNLGYEEDEKKNMTDFLQLIEMWQENNKKLKKTK